MAGVTIIRAIRAATVGVGLCFPLASSDAQGAAPPPTPPQERTAAQDATRGLGRDISNADILAAIQQAGLTQSQIRNRLLAAGYDPALADPFFVTNPGKGTNGPAARGAAVTTAEQDPFLLALGTTRRVDIAPPPGTDATDGGDRTADDPDGPAGADTETRRVQSPNRASEAAAPGLQVFGRQMFANAAQVFDPVALGPVDDLYRLGVGDQLQLVYTGDVEDAFQLTVRRDGTVIVPQIGQIPLAGLTMAGAKAAMRRYASRSYSGISAGTMNVDLSLTRVRVNLVFVAGEVEQPGAYQVSGLATAFHALVKAGGPSARGSMRRIELRRGDQVVREIDLYDYVLRGDASNDVRIESGDILFVPLNRRAVAIQGAVRRPGIFELREGETLGDLLDHAGGLLPTAATDRIQLDRVLLPEQRSPGVDRVIMDVRIPVGQVGAVRGIELRDHDIVSVALIGDIRRNSVELSGQVHQPGRYELRPGMTLSDLLAEAKGFLPYAMPDRIKLFRPIAETGRTQQYSLDVETDASFPVREFDRIEVLDARSRYPAGSIVVTGAVQSPGTRPYVENQTVADAIDLSGGLREDAAEIEIATRRLGSVYSDTLVRTQTIRLPATGVLGDGASGIVLQRDDQVHVRIGPGFRPPQSVRVAGLFAAPGTYPIRHENERVSEIIRRAGGALPLAYGPTFRVTRLGVPVVVDYHRAIRGDKVHDLPLQDGDEISIGPDPKVVVVTGAVVRPAVFPYVARWSLQDYVSAAGGVAEDGDRSRISVMYASGATATTRQRGRVQSRPRVESGSVIVVAAKPEGASNPLTATASAVSTVAQTSATLLSIILGYKAVTGN